MWKSIDTLRKKSATKIDQVQSKRKSRGHPKNHVKDSEGAWRCVSFQAHTCTALNQVKARTASTAYTPAQLAPIASRKLVENPKYDATGLKSDLKRYLCLDPTRSFVQSVMTIARAKLNGDPSGELAKLPVLAQLLREQGHRCEVHTLGAK
ncbi:hypothetical protein CYMTET_11630 [Cymbomonas tetramitiformis]|uniref:Uncharacterized protein n=1 Tax=Cymbomonas tetramitiformis TaxID=36881 RepID=A0AAE0GNB9_9CHLO|nr:hypothetical protein CYMTET_11630 [Cymbomonas tetramitiformis]